MKRFYVILILFFSYIYLYSQSDFRPGYYLTNNNDTVFGLIDYHGDIINSKVCSFKKDASAKTIKFLPETIKGYRFIGSKYYVAKELPNDSAKNIVFMEYLFNGKVSIYYRRTSDKDQFFIEKDGKMMQMNNDEKITTNEYNTQYSKNTNQYIGVLKYYFQDAPSILLAADNVEFNKKSIINIAKEYHEKVCKGEQYIVYEMKKTKVVFHYGFYLGSEIYNINIMKPSEFIFNANLKPALSLGVLFQANIPFLSEKLFIQSSGGYESMSCKFQDREKDYQLKQSVIHTAFDVLYKIPYKKIKPNLSIGCAFNFILSSEYQYTWYSDASPTTIIVPSDEISKNFMGPTAGCGFEIPITSHLAYYISFKYEYEVSKVTYRTATYQGYSFSTGILF